jgi:very-short-patch-repair endonuclease
MLDLEFLKILRDKLANGSTNSVLLNCIPGTSLSKIDAFDLNLIEDNLAATFIEKLFTEETFIFNISYQHIPENELDEEKKLKLELLSRKLNRIYNDNELSFQEKGHKTFGFGYPLFVMEIEDSWVKKKVGSKDQQKRLICAPLFIWPLEIKKSFKQNRTWSISKLPDTPPFLNDTFVSFIKQKRQVDLIKTLGNDTEESISYPILERKVSNIIRAVNSYEKTTNDIVMPNEYIFPLHTKEQLKEKAAINGYIEWSGVFSLYSKQKQSLINEIDQLIERKDQFSIDQDDSSDEPYSSIFVHGFTATDTDHSQQAVINQLSRGNKFIIQGPPGTGKSQTLTALITNALSNGAKCLVVCEKTTALEVLYDNLNNLGLGDLCGFINDPVVDRRKIVEKVRSTPLINYPRFYDVKFNQIIEDLQKQIADLSQGYKALAAIIWEDQRWADMLGKFLKTKKIIKNNPLKDELKTVDWEFTSKEYHHYVSILNKVEELINNITFPIDKNLHNRFFTDERKGFIKETINDIYKQQIGKALHLKQRFKEVSDQYYIDVTTYYSEINTELENLIQSFNDVYSQLEKIAPEMIQMPPASLKENVTKVTAIFSAKTKKALKYKTRILNIYNAINKASGKIPEIRFNFLSDPEFMPIDALKKSIDEFDKEHKQFITTVPDLIEKKMNELLNEHKEIAGIEFSKLQHLIDEYKQFSEEFNASKLFKEELLIEEKANFYEYQKSLFEIIERLENVNRLLQFFSAYYDYQSFFLKLTDKEHNVVPMFTNLQDNKLRYADLFNNFYFERILLQNEKLNVPKDIHALESLYQKIETFKKILVNKTLSTFSKKQWESINSYPQYKALYNLRGGGGQRRNSLRQIINHNFHFFTNFFPIILTNPTACATLFPLTQDIFNIVIFDEASQLRLEDTYSALLRGKIKVVSGDQHQMPPPRAYEPSDSGNDDDTDDGVEEDEEKIVEINITKSLANSESLLDYSITKGYTKTPLLVHYRSNHPALIEFSNNAFYSGNLLPIIKEENYTPIIFNRVDGLYTQRTNPAEADKAIEILDSLVDLEKGICPSVGIATFNLYQRDLINDKLSQKAAKDPLFAEKLHMLNSNHKPLFVKNLENIQGDERDVIIITTTFGKDEEGKFRKHFGPLNNKNGYRLLNVIITRAKDKLFICTSIPQEEILKFENELKKSGKNDGVPIVLAYLAYAQAISEGNNKDAKHILALIQELSTEEKVSQPRYNTDTESPFEEEVYDELTKIIDNPERIASQVWIGTFRVDFLILPKNKNQKKLIIECDGATYHGSTEAYAYDYFRMKQLEENGYIVHKIWSSNWWDEEEYSQELKKVKNLLEEYDQPPTEGSRFYDTPEQPKEPEVTKEIRKLIQNDIEQENIMTGFTTDSVSDEEIEDMIEMKSATDPLRLKPVTKNVELTTDLNRQSSLFSSDVDISTNKDVWFKLSHWGKETGNFNGFQNRACYSLGSYIEKHKKLTAKQESYGKKLFECAVEKGFVYSNI